MKKFISILIVLALCVSLCAVASAEEDWTIFVYLCGADLESENSMATGNMQQMIDANTGPNVRFVVETGGASSWHNGANPDKLDRFLITGGSSTLVDSQPSASMGKAETLADFLRWGLAAYPASHVGLVLWDHGSGSINGVCFDELNDDESLYLTDLDKALKSVQGSLPNGFDFIGFDACLMSTVETAAILAPYARYMVASEEVEPGTGWDYAAIGRYLDANPSSDGAAAGKAICDSYYDSCVSNDDEED
ncbi:MAG: peptidase C11 clostripain, partial [Oscillospiraceae bacterium]|nr:peptidase C11 clostripain [Oscillospiraceae bacterium]